MLFILLWKLVIADRVLAVLAEKAALQQTKRFLIGNRNFTDIPDRSAVGDEQGIKRRILLWFLFTLIMLQKLLELVKCKFSLEQKDFVVVDCDLLIRAVHLIGNL